MASISHSSTRNSVPPSEVTAWGHAVSTDKVEQALKDNPEAKILAFVHAETSTGAQSDAKTLCKLAHQYDCITIVDAVTSLGGTELRVDHSQF
jgi:alanine-glyoxylate transaminase/serine-glyoxylate transaminase/serine-pyruvate transaminase